MIHALAAGGLKMTTIYFLVAALLGRSGLLHPLALEPMPYHKQVMVSTPKLLLYCNRDRLKLLQV
jgi:hypothetical protein